MIKYLFQKRSLKDYGVILSFFIDRIKKGDSLNCIMNKLIMFFEYEKDCLYADIYLSKINK